MATAISGILDKVAARLALISTANGYYTNPKKIERARMTPWQSYDLPAINYWPINITNTYQDYAEDERTLTLYIEIHSTTQERPFCDVAGELAADIVVALHRTAAKPKVSDDTDYNLTDSVMLLDFKGYDYEIGEGQSPWCGALCQFEIKYTTTQGNMTTYA